MSCGSVEVSEPPPSGTVPIDDGEFHKLEGSVKVTCSSQVNVTCYATPAEQINIDCGTVYSYGTETSPSYIGQCGSNGQGGSMDCTVPAGKNVYCKKQ